MSWINDKSTIYRLRDNDYNRSVCMTVTNLNKMMQLYDTIFDPIANQTDEIASLMIFPLYIRPYLNPNNNYLKTSAGVNSAVTVYKISWYAYYQTVGEYYVEPKFNNFADYKGYTHIRVFLPYLGFVDIDPNECMGKWLQFRLYIDFYTGKGMYIIGVSDNSISHAENFKIDDGEDSSIRIISTFECDLAIEVPLGKSNIGDIKRNLAMSTIKIASGAISSHISGNTPYSVDTTSKSVNYSTQARGTEKGSRLKTIKSGSMESTTTTTHTAPKSKAKQIGSVVEDSVDVLNNINLHGSTDRVNDAACLYQTSHNVQVVIYRPKFAELPSDFGSLYGYPLGQVKTLAELTGYTEINAIHIEGLGFEKALQSEIAMLEEQFAHGIIL